MRAAAVACALAVASAAPAEKLSLRRAAVAKPKAEKPSLSMDEHVSAVDSLNRKLHTTHGRSLATLPFSSAGIFPEWTQQSTDDYTSYYAQIHYGEAVALTPDGSAFAIGQPSGLLPFTAPPGASVLDSSYRFVNVPGLVTYGKVAGANPVVTQRGITVPGIEVGNGVNGNGADFGSSLAISDDGNVIAVGADDTILGCPGADCSSFFLFSGCKNDATGCTLSERIVDPDGQGDEFGDAVAISPEGKVVATNSYDSTSVYVFFCNKPGSDCAGSPPLEVVPPTDYPGWTFDSTKQTFGVNVKLTWKGENIVVTVASTDASIPDTVLVYRLNAGVYTVTNVLTPGAAYKTGFGFALSISEPSASSVKASSGKELKDKDNDYDGPNFVLAIGQPGAGTNGAAWVYTCGLGEATVCLLKKTWQPTTSIATDTYIGSAIAVSGGGRTLALVGISGGAGTPTPSPYYATVHVYQRTGKSWNYELNEVFTSYAYGGGNQAEDTDVAFTNWFVPVSAAISKDGSKILVGFGGELGAATLFVAQ